MATWVPVNAFTYELCKGTHDFANDTFTVALCAAANAPTGADAVLADLTQISYTNLSSRTLTLSGANTGTINTDEARVAFADLTLTASGGSVATWRYVVLYHDTDASDTLVAYLDTGSDQTLADGDSRIIDFTNANQALFTISVT